MIEFYGVVTALILLAALFVVFPIMQERGADISRRKTNVEAFRERQRELRAELSAATIDQAQYDELNLELQRRLLEEEDASAAGAAQPASRSRRWIPLALAVFIGVLALSLYHFTGFRPDWEIRQTLEAASARAAAGKSVEVERAQLLRQLQSRLAQRPDNAFYQMLEGNLQLEMGLYDEADAAFARLRTLVPGDPSVMALALEAKYLRADRRLTPDARALAERILELDPRNIRTLSLMGIDSFEAQRYADAMGYWQRLLPLVGPFSPNGKMISQGIERARQLLAQQGGEVPAAEPTASAGVSLQVRVALADTVQADPDATVFVYARAAGGPPMPLAVQRLAVRDLPATVTLDDSMAMAPGMNLSSAEAVELVARISRRGLANRSSGDIEGVRGPLQPAEVDAPVALVIDQVVP